MMAIIRVELFKIVDTINTNRNTVHPNFLVLNRTVYDILNLWYRCSTPKMLAFSRESCNFRFYMTSQLTTFTSNIGNVDGISWVKSLWIIVSAVWHFFKLSHATFKYQMIVSPLDIDIYHLLCKKTWSYVIWPKLTG